MTVLLVLFLAAATVLWLSVFGYLVALGVVAFTRPRAGTLPTTYPEIAVVVPTLNEESFILPKLRDLQRTDYPRDRTTVIVVDGGSADRTTALVQQEIDTGAAIHLLRLDGARGKTDQINHALALLRQDFVVVTDADAALDSACIRELVGVLLHDPATAVVGATVRPASALLEERMHWWFLNYLWWLEGEVLSAAMVSGVCYAVRRVAARALPLDAACEDAHVALSAAASGLRVRLCRTAIATEVRVPQTAREFLRFRRRRGMGYRRELLRITPRANAPAGWRVARSVRVWHFLVTPAVGAGLAVAACALLWTPHWPWPLITLVAFAAPVLLALHLSTTLAGSCPQRWRLGLAAGHLLGLTWLSLVTLGRPVPTLGDLGDR
jgi:cellulose synthase/poly-beta-1,6-N-acetylglucosamine synthase-like glycosyltransferase